MGTIIEKKTGTEQKKVQRLPLGIKLSFGIGDISNNIFIVTTGMYLLFFMTNVLGINPALAGMMLLFPKIWDVISDPVMGAITDVTRSRFGRRRPYLLYGAIPFGLAFYVLFIAPGHETEFANALQVSLLFALGCTLFKMLVGEVPFNSGTAVDRPRVLRVGQRLRAFRGHRGLGVHGRPVPQ